MAFDQAAARTPTSIGYLRVTLKDDGPGSQGANFAAQVLDQNGDEYEVKGGNLVPHLTQQQIAGLLDFMTALRTQAEEQILP